MFRIDDPDVPIVEAGPRSDYLVAHVTRERCLITIVEMKGTEEKKVERGIDQIRAVYRRLREEMATCLPGSWRRARIQAILLTPYNSHINARRIEEARKEGIDILPLQYHHQAELYPYISRPVDRTARYVHDRSLRHDKPELNPVERLIAEGRLERRVRDAFFEARLGGDRDTFHLSFRRPGDPQDAVVHLSATTKDAILSFSAAAAECRAEVQAHLHRYGLSCPAMSLQPG